MTYTKNRLQRFQPPSRHYLLFTFAITLAAAIILFLPFISMNQGIMYYYGDFNVQEIPFYQMIHQAVRSGEMGWSHTTDLGSDVISSYSFYLIGSPFFWLTIPFPNWMVPYLIGPLLMLKFACAGSAAYIYLRRYVKNQMFAVIGGLLYAFSGFSIYNVFFFHFHEPMIMFPLMLAAFDAFHYDRRRGAVAIAVFAACIVNYYFFVGMALFTLIYYLVMVLTKTYRFKWKEFLLLGAEVLIGFFATGIILLPSVLGLMGNPRLDSLPQGWNSVVYDLPQKYILIICAFFFPADMPAMPVFTPDSNCKWASVAGWLPLFGMTGVIAYLQLKKRDWLKKLIFIVILFAFVPVLNSMFQLLNSSIYYTRWFYMVVLIFILATIRAVEDKEADWSRAMAWSVGITAGIVALIGLMPNLTDVDGEESYSIGVQSEFPTFWIYAAGAMMCLLGLALIYKKWFNNKKHFAIAALCAVAAASLVTSLLIIGRGVMISGTTEKIKTDIINSRDDIDIEDLDYVRSDFYETVDNTSMFWQIQSINCFQSSVSPSIMKFYSAMGITRDVASRPDYSAYGLRPFLSCKYFFDDTLDNDDPTEECCFINDKGDTKMPGWKKIKTCNNFDIYENENYIPMGYTFDSYVTEEEFDRVNALNKTEALLYSMILTRDQMKKYADITGYYERDYGKLYSESPNSFKSIVDDYTYGSVRYEEACEELKKHSCDSFEYTKDGFKAHYDNRYGDDDLLFFTVPYSSGFTAYVNGEQAEIEQVDYGFMAVKIPGFKSCDISFKYQTPGLGTGVLISAAAAAAFAIYITVIIIYRKKKSKPAHKETDHEFLK